MKHIAIFASGSGSNAENIINFFKCDSSAKVSLVLSNKADAYVLNRANKLSVKTWVFNRKEFTSSDGVLKVLAKHNIDLIVLAGFLWKVPSILLNKYIGKVINIHPALLPKYGGKGMYGMFVHNAVLMNKEKESGITIHYVNQNYDEGDIIFQVKCQVGDDDNVNDLANKIHYLEMEHFPPVIKRVLLRDE